MLDVRAARHVSSKIVLVDKILSNIHDLRRWPPPPESPSQLYFSMHVLEEKSSTTFDKLPVELLLGIFHQIPLPSYLSLSATCKSL